MLLYVPRNTSCVALLLLLTFVRFVNGQTYRSVSVDGDGRLTLILTSGERIRPAMVPDQIAFQEAMLSQDGRTAGWLAAYPDPGDPDGVLAGALVLYRSGRTLRIFPTDQVFYSWRYGNDGENVAFCTGPTHGGAATCELHDVGSGRRLARWNPKSRKPCPKWAAGLRY